MGMEVGPLHVRRSVFIQSSPSRVWQEFASTERLRGWLDQGHKLNALEPQVGSQADFSIDMDGREVHFGGRVVVCDEERELSFESQWQGEMAWSVPTFWTIRLGRLYGGTLVELFHHGFERLGADAADQLSDYEQGWGVQHLVKLRQLAES